MAKHTDRAAHAKLDAIYARLPKLACQRLCGEEICGPIPMTVIEADRLRRAVHETPRTTGADGLTCSLLDAKGGCRAYHARPLICRTFGLVKRMSCPHGCVPERWLTDEEFLELAQAVERVGGPLVVTGPEGAVRVEDSFLGMTTDDIPREQTERLADLTRGLRAIHHGRVLGVTREGAGGWVHIDDARKARQHE